MPPQRTIHQSLKQPEEIGFWGLWPSQRSNILIHSYLDGITVGVLGEVGRSRSVAGGVTLVLSHLPSSSSSLPWAEPPLPPHCERRPLSPHSCNKGSSLILGWNFWNWNYNLSLHYFVQVFVTGVCYFLATHPGQCQVFLTLNQSKEENNLLGIWGED